LIRDNLVGLFFVSVGLLLDPRVFVDHGFLIVGLALAAMLVKGTIMAAVGMGLGFGARASVGTGILNAQIGEFAFVLAQVARKLEKDTGMAIFPPGTYEPFVAVAILTMVLMPGSLKLWTPITAWIERRSAFRSFRRSRVDRDLGALPGGSARTAVSAHVVVIGYGLSGKNVVRMLKAVDIPVIVIEMNPHTVRAEREKGTMIFYGDAARVEVLAHAGVARAKAVVVTIPDAAAAEAAVQAARKCSPDAYIVVRTRYVREVARLRQLGANSVVPEEFETSLELAAQSMEAMGASEWGIAQQKSIIREDQYQMLLEAQGGDASAVKCSNLLPLSVLLTSDVAAVSVPKGSAGIGATLAEIDLRRKTGASVIGVSRGPETLRAPGGSFEIREGDVLYLFGSTDEIDAARIALAGAGHEPMPSEARRTARKMGTAGRG
jgi:CPA2 family monovalent cation:H+ antiporter-2